MTKLLPLLVALAVSLAAAAPYANEKRQELLSPELQGLFDAVAKGQGGEYMGEENAIQGLTALAKMLGATRDTPGGIGPYTAKTMNQGFGVVQDPAGAAPARVVTTSKSTIPGAQSVKLRYGPYKVPNMNTKNQLGEMGMLYNYPHENLAKPCDGDCTVTGMVAGLEYPNGTNANIDTGMWLHHMVLFNVGEGRNDPTCNSLDISLPHITVGSTARGSERIFASGNERTRGVFSEWGANDVGYKMKSGDKLAALVELMNQTPEDKVVYLTMTYDVVPGHPFKDDVKIVWFDVRQCGTSEVNPPKGKAKFTVDYSWTANIEGEVIGAIGHLHDGGESVSLTVDGKKTCEGLAQYGTKPEFVQPPMPMGTSSGGHGHGDASMKHISDINTCHGSSFALPSVKKGQKWTLDAGYDMDKYKGMAHEDGSLEAVMGINIMFVRTKGTV